MIDQTTFNIAARKLAEASRLLLDAHEGKPSLRVLRIATESTALACEALALGMLAEREGE